MRQMYKKVPDMRQINKIQPEWDRLLRYEPI